MDATAIQCTILRKWRINLALQRNRSMGRSRKTTELLPQRMVVVLGLRVGIENHWSSHNTTIEFVAPVHLHVSVVGVDVLEGATSARAPVYAGQWKALLELIVLSVEEFFLRRSFG